MPVNPYPYSAMPTVPTYGANYSLSALRGQLRGLEEPNYETELAGGATRRTYPSPVPAPKSGTPLSLQALAPFVGRAFQEIEGESWEGSRARQAAQERLQNAAEEQILHQSDPQWTRMNEIDDLNHQAGMMTSPAAREIVLGGQRLGNEQARLQQKGMYDLWASPEARDIANYEDERTARLAEEANKPLQEQLAQRDRAAELQSMTALNRELARQNALTEKAMGDNISKIIAAGIQSGQIKTREDILPFINQYRAGLGLADLPGEQAQPAAPPSRWYNPRTWGNRGPDPDPGAQRAPIANPARGGFTPTPAPPPMIPGTENLPHVNTGSTYQGSPLGENLPFVYSDDSTPLGGVQSSTPGVPYGALRELPIFGGLDEADQAVPPAAPNVSPDRVITTSQLLEASRRSGRPMQEMFLESIRRGYQIVPDPSM